MMDQRNLQPPETSQRLSYRPILLTLLASFLLTGGSFFGCARSFNPVAKSSPWGTFFFWSFFVFAVATVVTFFWLVIAIIINLVRDAREVRRGGF